MKKQFIFLDHIADIKCRIKGNTLPNLFENTASAFSFYCSSGESVKGRLCTKIKIKAENKESLLYVFIDELVYLLDAEFFLVRKSEVSISENTLTATLYGDDARKYRLRHVKAVTYAEMYITQSLKGWEAQVVLDV